MGVINAKFRLAFDGRRGGKLLGRTDYTEGFRRI